jgi:arylsulfatase A-like enzyme
MLGDALPPEVSTLAELFKTNTYNTYASVVGPLEGFIGFDRGFDYYRMRCEKSEHMYTAWGDKIIRMIKDGFRSPWFAYLHFWELHQPRIVLDEYNTPEYGKTLYERALVSWDTVLARIIDALPSDTLLVLTGDHGELIPQTKAEEYIDRYKTPIRIGLKRLGFTEETIRIIPRLRARLMRSFHAHGLVKNSMATMIGHGYHVYDALVRVPFIILHDSLLPSGRRINAQVSQVDIYPTLVQLLDLTTPRQTPDGNSLLPLVQGTTWTEMPAFIEAGSRQLRSKSIQSLLGAVRFRGWKYIFPLDGSKNPEELYHLTLDPHERRNLVHTATKKRQELRALALSHFNSPRKRFSDDTHTSLTESERTALESKLRDLGYL